MDVRSAGEGLLAVLEALAMAADDQTQASLQLSW